jgi:hypothetical protein
VYQCNKTSVYSVYSVLFYSVYKKYSNSNTEDWFRVKTSHFNKIREKNASSKSYQIPAFNHYMVLRNLEELNNILKAVQNVSHISRKKPANVENHAILLIGDSQARGITERLATHLRSSYRCTGYVQPNADLNTITSTGISEVKTLTKNYVIMYAGAMDIARNNTMKGLSVLQFIKNSAHTNVMLLSAHQRFIIYIVCQ